MPPTITFYKDLEMTRKKYLTYHQWMKVWEFGCLYKVMVINWETGSIERRIITGKKVKESFGRRAAAPRTQTLAAIDKTSRAF